MDLKPAPEIVSERLKSQFAPAYLTLTSIIQGVALAVLAARVEATYTQFDATDMILSTNHRTPHATLFDQAARPYCYSERMVS